MRTDLRLLVAAAILAATLLLFLETPVGGALALPLIGVALLDEDRLSLTEAARRLGVAPSTVWRWAIRGVRGIKLESHVWGTKRYTTEAALERFSERCTQAANGASTAPRARTLRQRQSDIDRAEGELARQGI